MNTEELSIKKSIEELRDKYHIQATLEETGKVRQKITEFVLDLEELLK